MTLQVRDDEVYFGPLKTAVDVLNQIHGGPKWTFEETVEICIEVDRVFERKGHCPALAFRARRGEPKAVATWVRGCRFRWLEPSRRIPRRQART